MRLVILAAVCLVSAPAQSFEVASVKPGVTNEMGGVRNHPSGRVEFRGCTLEYLIQLAFDVQAFQVTGGPTWTQSDHWDIDGKPPESSPLIHANPPYTKYPLYPEHRRCCNRCSRIASI